jgi:hypothetical protein
VRPRVSVYRRPGESDEDFMARVDAVAAAGPPPERGPVGKSLRRLIGWLRQ